MENLELCCFVALIKENLEIIWESGKHENCSLLSVEQDWESWQILIKYSLGF